MKTKICLLLLGGIAAQLLGTSNVSGADMNLAIPSTETIHRSSPMIYGDFLEHIFHSVHGGLWGEMIWNRSFEEPEPIIKPASADLAKDRPARYWQKMGQGTVGPSSFEPFNGTQSLELISHGTEIGLRLVDFEVQGKDSPSQTYAILAVKHNDRCRGSLWVRGQAPKGIRIQLIGNGQILAEQTLRPPQNEWQEFALDLTPQNSCPSAELTITALAAENHIWVDQCSLMADSARATGGFRPDLLDALRALKPALLRWPGGDFVFGYRWKTSVGPQAQRQGKAGWGDIDPCALGVDEFLKLCAELKTEPVMVVDVHPDKPELLQQNLDLLEYCNGPVTSTWGKVRADNGHPVPYAIKYWEIGNEMWRIPPESYLRVYAETATAFRKVDPSLVLIGCGSGQLGKHRNSGVLDSLMLQQNEAPLDLLSIHHYEKPEIYATGPQAVVAFWSQLGEQIGKSGRPQQRLFMSEWNAQTIDWRGGLYAAGLLIEMEKNPWLVAASPALLMRHASATEWNNAFINFDASRWFPGGNYLATKLWRDHYAPNQVALNGVNAPLNAVATLSDNGRVLFLKMVNPGEEPLNLDVALPPTMTKGKADYVLLNPGGPTACNSLEYPGLIHEEQAMIHQENNRLTFALPAYATGVVTLTVPKTKNNEIEMISLE